MRFSVITGFTAGVLGTLGDEAVHRSAMMLNLASGTTGHYIAELLFPQQEITLARLLAGGLTHLLAGGTLGIVLALILRLTGYNYSILKGFWFGAVIWIIFYFFRPTNDALVDFISHAAWGSIAAWFIGARSSSNG